MKNIQYQLRIHKRAIIRTLSVFVALGFVGGMIFYTYQYFSTQSRADAPIIRYALKSGSCETRTGATTCTITGQPGTQVPVNVVLTASGENKMSAVDLIFAYNTGTDGMLSFQGSSSVGFNIKAIESTDHKRTGNGRLLHLTYLADKNDQNLPPYDMITLNFEIAKPGTTRIMLITAASTIVGPNSDSPYQILPQNELTSTQGAQGDTLVDRVYNIKVTTGDQTGNTTPTPSTGAGTATPTPGSGGNDGGGDNPNLPENRKDITANMRIRFQGITSQPKNSNPIDVKVKLVEGRSVPSTYETISFTPQGDGTYVADHIFKNVNINGKYSILIKGPKHIQKRICDNSPSEQIAGTYKCDTSNITFKEGNNTLNLNNVVLLSGDIPLQNGIVDAVDIAYIRTNVGKSDAEVVARADLNYDGIVDTQDYTLIINALAFKYDE